MRNGIFCWVVKILSAIISFGIIFLSIQPFFIPKFFGDSSTIVKGYSLQKRNSIDVLFLGASQMFCTIDAGTLSDKYGISSYDFGASSQHLSITPFYFDTALRTQTPKLVMVEVCTIFSKNSDLNNPTLAQSFNPMDASIDKFMTINRVLNGDIFTAFKYTVTPLFLYHDRWKSMNEDDIGFVINPQKYIDNESRGFFLRDHVEEHSIAFFNGDKTLKSIPVESQEALLYIAEQCKEKNIKLVLFKAPVSNWTKGESLSVQQFSDKNNLEYIDLNENLKEIGINEKTDFYNFEHLNASGAKKTTEYLAKILPTYIED